MELLVVLPFTYPLAPFLVKEGGTHIENLVLTGKTLSMKYYEIKRLASKLRRNQTPSEKLLWSYLQKRQLQGRKFNRQHPVIYESNKNELLEIEGVLQKISQQFAG